MAGFPLSSVMASPQRRETYTLTASNPTLAIPSWAQGGKGIVYVTGVGAGAGGMVSVTSGRRGSGGGGGAKAFRLPIHIPTATATVAVTIGAGGAAVSATALTGGNAGGDTAITVGGYTLTLKGGLAPTSDTTGPAGGRPNRDDTVTATSSVLGDPTVLVNLALARGLNGGAGNGVTQGYGAGATSEWGIGGAGLAAGPVANTDGADATGYGAGGAGALWLSGGAATSGAGSPGFLILEFVEGL